MKKRSDPQPDVWNESTELAEESVQPEFDLLPEPEPETVDDLKPKYVPSAIEYSLAGLKGDFPTAKELEQFVFDERQVSLKLKGIDPEKKYEIALAVLKGEDIDPKYITGANPYLDNNDLIPEDPLKPIPRRDFKLPNEEPMSIFHDMSIPHPDRTMRALDAKVTCQFRTYRNGAISYEILGPLEKQPVGEKIDKYGRPRPEKFTWIDPRTGEQAIRYADGTYSKMGQRLRTLMEAKRVNRNQSAWSVWIDRSFTAFTKDSLENPWGDE